MMKSGYESWQVTTDPNTELNFAVYLACAFGLRGEQPRGPMVCWPEPLFAAPAAHAELAASNRERRVQSNRFVCILTSSTQD